MALKNHRSSLLSPKTSLYLRSYDEMPLVSGSGKALDVNQVDTGEGITIYNALMSQEPSYTLDLFSQLNLLTHLEVKNYPFFQVREAIDTKKCISQRIFKE